MTSIISNIWHRIRPKRAPRTIMIVGLDNSGKTSLLIQLRAWQYIDIRKSTATATVSSNLTIPTKRLSLNVKQEVTRPELEHDDEQLPSKTDDDSNHDCSINTQKHINTPSSSADQISPTIGYNYERVVYKNQTLNALDFSGQSRYRALWQEFYNSVDAIVFVIDSSDSIRLVVARDELENMLNHPYFCSLKQPLELDKQIGLPSMNNPFQLAQKKLVISQGKLIECPLVLTNQTKATSKFKSNQRNELNSSTTNEGAQDGRRTKVPLLFLANKTDLTNSVDTKSIVEILHLNQIPQDRHPWRIQATSVNTKQGIEDGFDWLMEQLS